MHTPLNWSTFAKQPCHPPDLFTTSCRMCCNIWSTLKLCCRGFETVMHPQKLLHQVPEQQSSLLRCSKIWQQPRWVASRPRTPLFVVDGQLMSVSFGAEISAVAAHCQAHGHNAGTT